MKFATLFSYLSVLAVVSVYAAPVFSDEEALEARQGIFSSKEYKKDTKRAHKEQKAAGQYFDRLDKNERSGKSEQQRFKEANRAGRAHTKAVKKSSRELDELEEALERRQGIFSSKEYKKDTKRAHKEQKAAGQYFDRLDKNERSGKSEQQRFKEANRAGRAHTKAVKKSSRELDELEEALERRQGIFSSKEYKKDTKRAHKEQKAAGQYFDRLDKNERSGKSEQQRFKEANRAGRAHTKAVKKSSRELDELEEALERRSPQLKTVYKTKMAAIDSSDASPARKEQARQAATQRMKELKKAGWRRELDDLDLD